MNRNTSISLGDYFDSFMRNSIDKGRYKNTSEVIRAGLRLLEEEESKYVAFKTAIEEGINSSRMESFDFDQNLKYLKVEKRRIKS